MYDYANEGMEVAGMFGVLAVVLVVYLVILGLLLANYIVNSLALYTIADRRRISNPWLAWIPYGNLWIIGSIVDCHDRQKGGEKKWRRILLALGLSAVVGIVLMYIFIIVFAVMMALSGEEPELTALLGFLIPLYVLCFILAMVGTAAGMCQAVCMYKIYEELAPEKSVKYFLLYLLVPLAGPICLMKCRNSEAGIPPEPRPFYYPPYDASIPPFRAPMEYAPTPAEESTPAPIAEPVPEAPAEEPKNEE